MCPYNKAFNLILSKMTFYLGEYSLDKSETYMHQTEAEMMKL